MMMTYLIENREMDCEAYLMLLQEAKDHHDPELCEDTLGLNQIATPKLPAQRVASISACFIFLVSLLEKGQDSKRLLPARYQPQLPTRKQFSCYPTGQQVQNDVQDH